MKLGAKILTEQYYSDRCVKYKLQLINIMTKILFNYNGS